MTARLLIAFLFVAIMESPLFFMPVTLVDAFSLYTAPLSSASLRDCRSCKRSHQAMLSRQRRKTKFESSSMIFLREPSTQETTSASEQVDESQASDGKGDKYPDVKDTVRKVGKNVGTAAVYGFSYFMNAIGLYFTFGLLLNIFGYAYEFSFTEGYKIDTIQNRRIERQFERESSRYEKERNEKLLQLSIGDAANTLGSETVADLAGSTN
jgi:hypothetical protein